MLEIAPEKVAHVIIKAREYDSKVATWDDSAKAGDAEEDPIPSSKTMRMIQREPNSSAFIDALDEDEQAHLVALAWIGRGTFGRRTSMRLSRPRAMSASTRRHATCSACRCLQTTSRRAGEALPASR